VSFTAAPRLGAQEGADGPRPAGTRVLDRVRRVRLEMLAVAVLAAVLNLWDLSRNDWANTFYSGAVRSMASSWHDFLFASLDRSGLMTVDKPPAALWVQALSARIFGFHPLSLLVPEALMGVAAVLLAADLTRRLFGRPAGFVAGLAFALTPISVAMARHNNPDELLILCCVAAMWCAVRGFQDGRTRWLAWCGALVGLGFETKMAVALFVVPGIAVAWLWLAPAGRGAWHALRQLLWGGLVLAAVALAWPLLVTLTPAADRPWISGTSDNSVWSLIVGYNGVGRVAGQAGGTGGGGGGFGGGSAGVFRLLDSALGGQAGWLLGFALVAGVGVLAITRFRRADPRTAWVLAVGGAALVSAIVFSAASGIFHPYYVSFLAPWVAMLVGAGAGRALSGDRAGQVLGVLAIAAGAVSELVVLGGIQGSVSWARPLVIAVCAVCVVALGRRLSARLRAIAVGAALAALLAAPAAWTFDTLGHATSSTFPAGGPESAGSFGGFGGAPGRAGARGGAFPGAGRFGAIPGGRSSSSGGGFPGAGSFGQGGSGSFGQGGGSFSPGNAFGRGGASAGGGVSRGGPGFGSDSTSLTAASRYVRSHGGGTIGVESQSSAADAILAGASNLAGLGGFSGVESSVSVRWLAAEVRDGHLRWLVADSSGTGGIGRGSFGRAGGFGGGSPLRNGRTPSGRGRGPRSDGRTGSEKAFAIAEKVARKVKITSNGTTVTLYDLKGKAGAILAAEGSSSSSSSARTV
jgi:4-amino-4-deoxy-L-arabinose transferase-like glycosyltransferase